MRACMGDQQTKQKLNLVLLTSFVCFADFFCLFILFTALAWRQKALFFGLCDGYVRSFVLPDRYCYDDS